MSFLVSTRSVALLLVGSVLLEFLVLGWRLPLFPGWVPLLLLADGRLERVAVSRFVWCFYVAFVTGLGVWAWGAASLGFSGSLLLGSWVAQRSSKRRALVFWAVAFVGWLVWALIRGELATGSLPFEVFFSALFTRLVGAGWLAGSLSRLLLLSLVLLTGAIFWGLGSLFARWWRPLAPSVSLVLLSFLWVGCRGGEQKVYFSKGVLASGESLLRFDFSGVSKSTRRAHPWLPPGGRGNKTCLSCHREKASATKRRRRQQRIHEIHLVRSKLVLRCTFCHQKAGMRGFPHLGRRGGRRTAYNRQCVTCHGQKKGAGVRLRWKAVGESPERKGERR